MADSWKTSRTRKAQQIQAAAVKADRKIHENGPWDEDGNLQLPDWMEDWPLMPATWPVEYMWMMAGKAAMEGD